MKGVRIGFAGVGRMGAPLARRLLDAGHALSVFDTSAAAVEPLVAAGATHAESPAALAGMAEVVLLSLPTPEIVEAVALGPDGIVSGKGARIVIDLSTTGSRVAKAVASGLADAGIAAVDCPVSGGVAGAEKGSLALMAACPPAVLEEVRPVLECFGKVFHVGDEPGMGQTIKVINNLMSVTALSIASEALVLGTKAGLDPAKMIEVINAGSGSSNATMTKIPKFVLPRSFDFGFAIELSAKDIRLCLEEAEAQGVPMIVASAVKQLLTIAKGRLGGSADLTEIIKPIEEWSGVEVAG
ncbi:NAD(P)-dependent oxidoreductase [Marinibaculum pumilum]|uniref:NAD(P)-dependent oxidoreductase n=1 Tax=Marinibaculum pumilum TaxID=1766165 RepID=A0ABV7KX18_9PROT